VAALARLHGERHRVRTGNVDQRRQCRGTRGNRERVSAKVGWADVVERADLQWTRQIVPPKDNLLARGQIVAGRLHDVAAEV
jgi:hypothetical protein